MTTRQIKRKSQASSSSSSLDAMPGPTHEELENGASRQMSPLLDGNQKSCKFDIAIDEDLAGSNINTSSISTITKATSEEKKSPCRSPLAGISRNDASLKNRGKTPSSLGSNPSKQLVFASPSPVKSPRVRRSRRRRERTSDDCENAFVTRRRAGTARGDRTENEKENIEELFGKDTSLSMSQSTSEILDISDSQNENIDVDFASPLSEAVARNEKEDASISLLSSSYDLPMTAKTFYPDKVRIPGPKVLERFYSIAISKNKEAGEKLSHQCYLDQMGSGLLSLEEVIIPAIAHEEYEALKRLQATAQRDINKTPDGELRLKAILLSRKAVKQCASAAIDAVRELRLKREDDEKKEEEMHHKTKIEEKQKAKQKRRQEKEDERQRRKKERAVARAKEGERVRKERKKNLPRNKELWREVALLMTDLARLQKEEKMWDEAKFALDKTESEMMEAKEKLKQKNHDLEMRESILDQETDNSLGCSSNDDSNEKMIKEEDLTNHVEDITLAANRINQTLKTTTDLMRKSDGICMEMTRKYRYDHMFLGYRGVNDPKSLIQSVAQD